MRKIFIIIIVMAVSGLTSCSKQQITPVAQDASNIPVWEKTLNDEDDDDNTKPSPGDDGNEITDPNNDPDGNKK